MLYFLINCNPYFEGKITLIKIFTESLFIIFPIHIQSEISNTNTINHNEIVTAIIQLSATFLSLFLLIKLYQVII